MAKFSKALQRVILKSGLILFLICPEGLAQNVFRSEMSVEKFNTIKIEKISAFKKITKPRVYFFWASWCEYCKEFGKFIDTFSNKENFEFIAIDTDIEKEAGRNALGWYLFTKNHYWLTKDIEVERKGILPLVVIIGRDRKIDTIYEGSQSDKLAYFRKRLNYLNQNKVNLED